MTNNDILRSIRYMLDISDGRVLEIAQLSDPTLSLEKEELLAFMKKEDEAGFVMCTDQFLGHFLDGLVVHFRGRDESRPARPIESRITNNIVLKKLRVAFELKDVDMHDVFEKAGFPVSKPELTAVFRQPGHKHYRACGDQMLRNFLKGLTLRLRGDG